MYGVGRFSSSEIYPNIGTWRSYGCLVRVFVAAVHSFNKKYNMITTFYEIIEINI